MLESLALRLKQSQPARHLFFLGATLVSVLVMGYHFGTFDQSIHIPFLKAIADPSLYPNDAFVALRLEHYSYFWFFSVPSYNLGILEEALFVAHLIATYLTFWMLYELSETLFRNPLSSMFGALAFVFPHISFAGFPLIEFSLLNRTMVMPFLLLAINLYLRKKRTRAFFMLGILYNLHVVSVNFVLAMFLLDFVLEFRSIGWKKIISSIFMFILAALPVLLWKMQDSGTEIQLESGWFDLITRSMLMHLFYLAGNFYVLPASISGLSAYLLYLFAFRSAPARPHDKTVMVFVLATALLLLLQGIVTGWLPISIIIQFQIIRAGIFGVIFGYLYFADYLARKWQADSVRTPGDGVLTTVFFLSTFNFVPILMLPIQRWWGATPARIKVTAIVLSVGFAGSLVMALSLHIWYPGLHIYGLQNTWRDAQEWAQKNTAKDAIFITPLNKWWIEEAEWRVFSERQTVTTLSELLEAAFEPQYMSIWQPRFETLAPGAIAQFRGDFMENRQIAGEIYNHLSTTAFLTAACKYHATYLVMEKPYPRELPLVYENADYLIYDLRSISCVK